MQLPWYFDFVSPFAYLHWQKLQRMPQAAQVQPVPILLGAVLEATGIRGPAEIPGKRLFTYRRVQWQAEQDDVLLRFPPAHPFNPLPALRLCIAVGGHAQAVDAIFDWIWRNGYPGDSAAALAPVAEVLGVTDPEAAIAAPEVKAQLRANTEAALAAGVFGVPTLAIGGELFWGNDAHGLIETVLADPEYLAREPMARLATLPEGIRRGG
ncbi:MAG: 2-hydroxychromene-2-carboxylate isomerase [Gammaproteobacteria bacterium]|jgi:2-hydroxychromene-2-carboxylate isomerase|uniref:2-hydroxychromene-2-carboxylate isomerase n=1 Tax=Xanthomonas boreopolis TaxID=86183 RepID=A0A919F965_9XANT|nr:2-hydroxychromene-2-carboxylate isomerase [Pseudomonas sp. Hp2]GHH55193.1 isomerase [[Pseudomonas] boreopolis]